MTEVYIDDEDIPPQKYEWICGDGRILHINEMEDSHLANTIALLDRRMHFDSVIAEEAIKMTLQELNPDHEYIFDLINTILEKVAKQHQDRTDVHPAYPILKLEARRRSANSPILEEPLKAF